MRNIIYFLFVGLFIISCQQNETANTEQAVESTEAGEAEVFNSSSSVFQVADKPSFIIDISTDDTDMPKSIIDMDMFGQRIHVTEAAVACERIDPLDYEKYQIPAAAVNACGGWWAGAGEYFYIIKKEGVNYYSVMQTKVSEEQESSTYDYQSIMNFTRTNK